MKKQFYFKPTMRIYEYKPASLLAGSLNVNEEDADESELY